MLLTIAHYAHDGPILCEPTCMLGFTIALTRVLLCAYRILQGLAYVGAKPFMVSHP